MSILLILAAVVLFVFLPEVFAFALISLIIGIPVIILLKILAWFLASISD